MGSDAENKASPRTGQVWRAVDDGTGPGVKLTSFEKTLKAAVLQERPNAVLMRAVCLDRRKTSEWSEWRVFDGIEALGAPDHGSSEPGYAWRIAAATLRHPPWRGPANDLPQNVSEYVLDFREVSDETSAPIVMALTEEQTQRLMPLLVSFARASWEAERERERLPRETTPSARLAAAWRAFVAEFNDHAKRWQEVFDEEAHDERRMRSSSSKPLQ